MTKRITVGRVLERVAIAVAALALSVGLIAILSGYFQSHDQAGLSGASPGPGQAFADQGDAVLPAGRPAPAYDSQPPTSGPHHAAPLPGADGQRLTTDQLLQALALGDVVILYGGPQPPSGLTAVAHAVAGPFSTALAASGQAVILARRPGTTGLIGLAWAHMIRTYSASDPALRQFAQFWLARGAPRR